ncbi:MAG: ATP-binding cassette domain-containing protein [Pseudonocardiaceae bacterium]|nr:ATP-binding cassette domain-containing protein [Pseudonocardiaceae bacterium]
MPEPALFQLQGAGVRFGSIRALTELDLDVGWGERVAVIGPSGAGKSSLIALLNGTLAPTDGQVRVLGRDIAAASGRERRGVQRRLGTIHQQFHLVEQLRAVHNVNAGHLGSWSTARAVLSLLAPRDVGRARQALERVGIGDKLYEHTGNLSGGEQQRVAIARVLVQRPAAVLADEPIASLDPARGREIMDLLHEISRETGTTLLASLHDVDIALERFERVVGLREGRIAFDAAPAALDPAEIEALYALERGAP